MTQEEELIQEAIDGCSDAFESIFKKYLPMVLRCKARYHLKDYDFDDWLQEARIACYQALLKYDNTQNVTFGLYYKINFERHIISLLRYQEAHKRKITYNKESLEQCIETKGEGLGFGSEDPKAKTSLEYVIIRENLEDFWVCLSKFEMKVYQCVLKGEDFELISDTLDVPVDKVRSGYNRVKRKLKDQIAE